jgi:peptidoglycan/LPS O-acetylase OafA/YrhL
MHGDSAFRLAAVFSVIWMFPVKASYSSPLEALLFFWLFIPVFGAMLLAIASGRGRACEFLATPVIVLLGEASFSIYILHEPLLRISQSFHVPPAASFVATIGLSVACFLWYERPTRKALRKNSRWTQYAVQL